MTIKVKQTKIIKYLLLINFIFVLSLLELKAQQNKFALSEELIDLNYNVYYSKTDSNGYFWLNNGKQISRYNGNSLKSFSSPDPNGIYVQGEILEDLDGNIWSSVYNHLIKINSKNQSVEKINIKGDTSICEKVLAFNPQKTLLWIKSDDRPIAIDPNTFEKIDTLPFKIDGNSIRLCFNNKNEVNGLISGFSHDKKTWYYYLNENKWQKTPIINHIESKNSKRVICNKGVFYILYNNSIVIASQGHFNTIKSNIPFKASDFIFYNNKLYISTYTKGIIIYDIKNKSWKEFDSNNLLFDKNITSIKRHKNQLVLFFKNKGIQFLNSSTSSINKIYNKEENSDILIKDKQVFIARPDSINIYSYEKYHLNIAESLIENSHKVNQLFNINESQILGVSKKTISIYLIINLKS